MTRKPTDCAIDALLKPTFGFVNLWFNKRIYWRRKNIDFVFPGSKKEEISIFEKLTYCFDVHRRQKMYRGAPINLKLVNGFN